MDERELKGLMLAATRHIRREGSVILVPSSSSSAVYQVELGSQERCTCEDFATTQKRCMHIWAGVAFEEREQKREPRVIDITQVPKRRRRGRDWAAYRKARREEKQRLLPLLHQLCMGVQEARRRPGPGRNPTRCSDSLYAILLKVFTTLSADRCHTDLRNAQEKGYLSKSLHPNSSIRFMNDARLTPILRRLVVETSRPLRRIDETFAADSTGCDTVNAFNWNHEKWSSGSVNGRIKDWVKLHLLVGTTTHTIAAVAIEGRHAGDAPLLKDLLAMAAKNFQLREVIGDKAYCSVENVELVAGYGAQPYLMPKENATGAAGGLFATYITDFLNNRERFLVRYHQRSNVESAISALKAKFLGFVRSRRETARVNEVLCKVVCYNLCILIRYQIEFGLDSGLGDIERPA